MLEFLRKVIGVRSTPMVAALKSETAIADAKPDLAPLVLERFLKPRTLAKAAPGWPSDLLDPIVRTLFDRGDIAPASIAVHLQVTYTVAQLKAMLRERGLPLSGLKGELIRRLVDAGAKATGPEIFECSAAGRTKAVAWEDARKAAVAHAATEAIALLKAGSICQGMQIVRDACAAWPTIQDIALQFNPLALQVSAPQQERKMGIILSANPAILSGLAPDDLARLRLAIAIWETGLPVPGIDLAMDGYRGLPRFSAERARILLFHWARNVWEVERLKEMGIKSATVQMIDACDACNLIDGKTFPVDALPELPHPGCLADGCHFFLKPITTF